MGLSSVPVSSTANPFCFRSITLALFGSSDKSLRGTK